MRAVILSIGLFLLAAPAGAAVASLDAGGFAVAARIHVDAAPEKTYAVLADPARWWNPQHSYSGDAANLHMDARAGGCWCESLPDGGSVRHMTVDYADPGKLLRLRGALGPLGNMAVDGVMIFSLTPAGGGTDISFAYRVGGYVPGGFKDLAPAVDGVLMEQLARLKAAAEKP